MALVAKSVSGPLNILESFRDFQRHFKLFQPLEFDFWAKFAKRPNKRKIRNIFFSVQKFLKGNMKGSKVVKVFLVGITILGRGILFVKFAYWRALKVESRSSDLPPRYVLNRIGYA